MILVSPSASKFEFVYTNEKSFDHKESKGDLHCILDTVRKVDLSFSPR